MGTDASSDPTATDTDTVFTQEQDHSAGQPSRDAAGTTWDTDETRDAAGTVEGDTDEPARGSGEADDDQAPIDQDDPELSGADLDEDQADGRGPSIEPGA